MAVANRQVRARNAEFAVLAACAQDEPVRVKRRTALAFDAPVADESGRSDVLVEGHARLVQVLPQPRARTDLMNHLVDARQEPPIVQGRLPDGNAIAVQLTRLAH